MLRAHFIFIISFLYCCALFGQTQTPKAIDTSDQRNDKEMFVIMYQEKSQSNKIIFSTNSEGAYHLKHLIEEKLIQSKKIEAMSAQKFDESFVDKFITMKYMLGDDAVNKCKDATQLVMRGEDLKICHSDIKRNPILQKLISEIKEKLI